MIIDFSYCNLMAILALELLARKADTDSKIKSGYSTIQKPTTNTHQKYPPESVLRELFLLPFVVRPLSLQMSIYSILSILQSLNKVLFAFYSNVKNCHPKIVSSAKSRPVIEITHTPIAVIWHSS